MRKLRLRLVQDLTTTRQYYLSGLALPLVQRVTLCLVLGNVSHRQGSQPLLTPGIRVAVLYIEGSQ